MGSVSQEVEPISEENPGAINQEALRDSDHGGLGLNGLGDEVDRSANGNNNDDPGTVSQAGARGQRRGGTKASKQNVNLGGAVVNPGDNEAGPRRGTSRRKKGGAARLGSRRGQSGQGRRRGRPPKKNAADGLMDLVSNAGADGREIEDQNGMDSDNALNYEEMDQEEVVHSFYHGNNPPPPSGMNLGNGTGAGSSSHGTKKPTSRGNNENHPAVEYRKLRKEVNTIIHRFRTWIGAFKMKMGTPNTREGEKLSHWASETSRKTAEAMEQLDVLALQLNRMDGFNNRKFCKLMGPINGSAVQLKDTVRSMENCREPISFIKSAFDSYEKNVNALLEFLTNFKSPMPVNWTYNELNDTESDSNQLSSRTSSPEANGFDPEAMELEPEDVTEQDLPSSDQTKSKSTKRDVQKKKQIVSVQDPKTQPQPADRREDQDEVEEPEDQPEVPQQPMNDVKLPPAHSPGKERKRKETDFYGKDKQLPVNSDSSDHLAEPAKKQQKKETRGRKKNPEKESASAANEQKREQEEQERLEKAKDWFVVHAILNSRLPGDPEMSDEQEKQLYAHANIKKDESVCKEFILRRGQQMPDHDNYLFLKEYGQEKLYNTELLTQKPKKKNKRKLNEVKKQRMGRMERLLTPRFSGRTGFDPLHTPSNEIVQLSKESVQKSKNLFDVETPETFAAGTFDLSKQELQLARDHCGYTDQVDFDAPDARLIMPCMVIEVQSREHFFSDEFREQVTIAKICIIRGSDKAGVDLRKLDPGIVFKESGDKPMDVRRQVPRPPETNCNVENGKESSTATNEELVSAKSKDYYDGYHQKLGGYAREEFLRICNSATYTKEAYNNIKTKMVEVDLELCEEPKTPLKQGFRGYFGSNVDVDPVIHKKITKVIQTMYPVFMQPNGQDDLCRETGETLPGINAPQFYLKVTGSRTNGHLENSALASFNQNFGPAPCVWYAVSFEFARKIFAHLIHEKVPFDLFWISEELLHKLRVPYYKITQRAGDIVHVGQGTFHWVTSIGLAVNIAWNMARPVVSQMWMMALLHDHYVLNKTMPLFPVSSLIWAVGKTKKFTGDRRLFPAFKSLLSKFLAHSQIEWSVVQEKKKEIKMAEDFERTPLPVERCSKEECKRVLGNTLIAAKPRYPQPTQPAWEFFCPLCGIKKNDWVAVMRATIDEIAKVRDEYQPTYGSANANGPTTTSGPAIASGPSSVASSVAPATSTTSDHSSVPTTSLSSMPLPLATAPLAPGAATSTAPSSSTPSTLSHSSSSLPLSIATFPMALETSTSSAPSSSIPSTSSASSSMLPLTAPAPLASETSTSSAASSSIPSTSAAPFF